MEDDKKKSKIRARYVGTDGIQVIPARQELGLLEDTREKRVAVYARVSTGDPKQTSSYELQRNHYQDMIQGHPGWTLAGIYADEGISGTSLEHRDAFVRMIEDCRAHKIDLILTKSVSRFARNVVDCIQYVRDLAALDPPVGIWFETEGINTLNSGWEFTLTVLSATAQEESHNKSEIMNVSIDMRFRRGIFLTPPLLGYDQDEDGNLIVNESEAKTVRLIFGMYLYGYTCTQIADALTQLKRPTKSGRTIWSSGTVLGVLQNERHCGDVLARKTWTPNYLDHKSKKNRHDRNQYYQAGHHAAIISRDDFMAVQQLIRNAKYGNKGFFPELYAVSQGALKGFVLIHPRWAGFHAKDYLMASASVDDASGTAPPEELRIQANAGDFDYRGYEVARAQFFDVSQKLCVTFSPLDLAFSSSCVRKLPDTLYVELLLHPHKQLLAVRPSEKANKRALQWAKPINGVPYGRSVSGRAFLPSLYTILGWNRAYKYRVRGIRQMMGGTPILLFDMRDTEIFVPAEQIQAATSTMEALVPNSGTSAAAYPAQWAAGFGPDFYCQREMRKLELFGLQDNWAVEKEELSTFQNENSPHIPDLERIRYEMAQLINEMKQEVQK